MNKTLYLMRHAQAGNAIGIKDFDRPLTPEGIRDARHMGNWYNAEGWSFDLIICSSAFRAVTTANEVAEAMGITNVTEVDELYEASIRTMLELVQKQDSTHNSILVIGHNPAISYLAEYLIGDRVMGMEPGGVFRLSFEIDDWKFLVKGLASSYQFQSPRDVP